MCCARAEEYETTHHVIMCLVATYQHLFARATPFASAVPQLVASSQLTYSVIQLSLSNGMIARVYYQLQSTEKAYKQTCR